MKTIGSDSKKLKAVATVLLFVMIIVQLGMLVFYMAEKKQGYHMDELWSYGLSNSYYQPHLYTRFGFEEWNEYNEWQDSGFFREYLTVGKDERFEYGSVYYNQEYDVHPPLYYYILHTVCSFFPESFSPWYAFSINAVSFVAVQVFLYLCVLKISKSRFLGLVCCALWGFSTGAISCFIYLRMYALLMAFTMIYTYLNLKLIYDGITKKRMLALCLVTYLGSLTQYFFIVFAGVMAACACVYYLVKKSPKKMLTYGSLLLLSVGMAVLSFTPMISHLLGSKDKDMGIHTSYSKHKTFGLQIHFILRYMIDEISGIKMHLINAPVGAYALCVLAVLAAVGLPLCFLFRNEIWFKSAMLKMKLEIAGAIRFIRSKIGFTMGVLVILAVSVASVFVVNGLVSPIAYMKMWSSHYSVQVYPLFILVVMCFAYMFLRSLPKVGTKVCAPVALAISIFCIIGSRSGCEVNYLFDENATNGESLKTEMNEITEGADCILVCDGGSTVQFYPWDLMDADSLYVMMVSEAEDNIKDVDVAGQDGDDVYLVILSEAIMNYQYKDEADKIMVGVIQGDEDYAQKIEDEIDIANDNMILDLLKEESRFHNIEYIGSRMVYKRVNYIYKLT